MPATCPACASAASGPSQIGCRTYSVVAVIPTKPTSAVVTAPSAPRTSRSASIGVTRRVCSAPSRRTTTSSVRFGAAWMMADAAAKLSTSVPSTETMTSPGWMPASAAGDAGSPGAQAVWVDPDGSTHSLTAAIVVVAVCTPMPLKTIANSTTAITRFISGPPSMTMTRCHTGSS